MHAVARITYRGLIDNVQASWVKIGFEGVKQLLQAGVNDLGGTLIDENISRAAGADHGQIVYEYDFIELVEPLGRNLVQRSTLYKHLDTSPRLEVTREEDGRVLIPVTTASDIYLRNGLI